MTDHAQLWDRPRVPWRRRGEGGLARTRDVRVADVDEAGQHCALSAAHLQAELHGLQAAAEEWKEREDDLMLQLLNAANAKAAAEKRSEEVNRSLETAMVMQRATNPGLGAFPLALCPHVHPHSPRVLNYHAIVRAAGGERTAGRESGGG